MKITKNFIITLSVTLLVLGTIVTIIILLNKKTKSKPSGPKPPSPGPRPKPPSPKPPSPKPPSPGPGPPIKPGEFDFPNKTWDCKDGKVIKVDKGGKYFTKVAAEALCNNNKYYECRDGKCKETNNINALYINDDKCNNMCLIESNPNPKLENEMEYPPTANFSQTPCQKEDTFDPSKPAFNIDPRLMLFSSSMMEASKKDNNDWSNYGIATHSNDKGNCGRCYQIEFEPHCGSHWTGKLFGKGCQNPYGCYNSQGDICTTKDTKTKCKDYPKKPLIVQNFNTGIDCSMIDYNCNLGDKKCTETIQQCEESEAGKGTCTKEKWTNKNGEWVKCTGSKKDDCSHRKIVGNLRNWKDDGGQFDIYMGLGGLGAFDGCTDKSDKQKGFYGGKLEDWLKVTGNRYGGATKIEHCENLAKIPGFRINDNDWNNKDGKNFGKELIEACKKTFEPDNRYHGNWAVKYKEVECPDNLIKTTGLALKNRSIGIDGKQLPKADINLLEKDYKKGFTSTMMDCCKPSCSWQDMYNKSYCAPNNNRIDDNWRSLSFVDYNGNKLTRKDDENILKPFIQSQPNDNFNCTTGGDSKPGKICYYNDTCMKGVVKDNTTQKYTLDSVNKFKDNCSPQKYCKMCKQIGEGQILLNINDEEKWSDVFQESDENKLNNKILDFLNQNNSGGVQCKNFL